MKDCGHPDHPEDGNTKISRSVPVAKRGAEVAAHMSDPQWFEGRHVKVPFDSDDGNHEWMWVLVQEIAPAGEVIIGVLKNTPLTPMKHKHGDRVHVAVQSILDVEG